MRILLNIHEMTYKRPKVKDAIDDHVHQIVENWCLVWVVRTYGIHKNYLKHWTDELGAQMLPGIDKLRSCALSEKAKRKLVDEVLISDARVDVLSFVEEMIEDKFSTEGIDDSLVLEAAQAWVDNGLNEVRDVLLRNISLKDYKIGKMTL